MAFFLPVLVGREQTKDDAAIGALAGFLGIDTQFVNLDAFLSGACNLSGGCGCAAVGGSALRQLAEPDQTGAFRDCVTHSLRSLFIYAVDAGDTPLNTALAAVTKGAVRSVAPLTEKHAYMVSADRRGVCRQVGGQRIGPVDSTADRVLIAEERRKENETLIAVDGRPFFLVTAVDGCDIFIAATTEVADIRQPVFEECDTNRFFSRLVPAAMFLRNAFGDALWHGEKGQACLIIDDPLLKERYGFLNFRKLARAMDGAGFTTSIAFIPWNFRRTSPLVATLLSDRVDRFSICVHGCDHTGKEFGSRDEVRLDRLVRKATTRMNDHRRQTGLPFDNVMVFPQGVFSTGAMQALKANNYLAAVNAEAIPIDLQHPLRLASFLEPAITDFHGFPLFLRRWPRETAEMAVDLFWGRPIFVLAHHDFFKEGYGEAMELADKINAIAPKVSWGNPGDIVRSSQLIKREDRRTIRIRAYSPEIVLANHEPAENVYVVEKTESLDMTPSISTSSGKTISATTRDGVLQLSLQLKPGERETIKIRYRSDASGDNHRKDESGAKVMFRRYLSEMRDNHLSRYPVLLVLASKLKNCLPV